MKGMPRMVQDKSFSVSMPFGGSVLTTLLFAGGCSAGTDRLSPWPGVESTEAQSSDSEDSDSSTGEVESSSHGDDKGSNEKSFPEKDSMEPGDGTTEENSSEHPTSSESETDSEPGPETDENGSDGKTSEEDSGSGSCDLELCLDINGTQELLGDTWSYRRYIFPFKIPKRTGRLARVELMEGFARGRTSAVLKSSIGKGQGPALARWSWEVDMPNHTGWNGGDLDEPIRLRAGTWYWFEFIPAEGSVASVAKAGRDVALWRRNNPTQLWVKDPAPAMFRAYCCVE